MSEKHPSMEDFKRRELRLQQINLEIQRLTELQHAMSIKIDTNISAVLRSQLYKLIEQIHEQVKNLIAEEQTHEEFLIENEAPGWTST